MSNIVNVYISGITASQEKLEELVIDGVVNPIYANNQQTRMYVDALPGLDKISQTQLVDYTVKNELPTLLKMLNMWKAPQSRFQEVMLPLTTLSGKFTEQGEAQPKLAAFSLQPDQNIHIKLRPKHKIDEEIGLFTIEAKQLNKHELKLAIENDPSKVRYNFLPRQAFKYLDSTGHSDSNNIEKIRSQIANLHNTKSTPIALLGMMPNEYYRTQSGLEKIVINCVRNIEGINAIDDLNQLTVSVIGQTRKVARHLSNLPNLQVNLESLHNFINGEAKDMLKSNIEIELNFMKSFTQDAFRLTHYNKSLYDIVRTSNGLMKTRPDQWTTYTSLSMLRTFENALFESLLPEVKQIDKNPMQRISNATMLIGNVNIQKVPVSEIVPRFRFQDEIKKAIEKEWKMPSSPLYSGGATSVHTTSISDKPLFEGYFEGIPHIEKEQFKSQMQSLMHSEQSAKLSGAQYKLPVTLSKRNGDLHLKRQQGKEGFTHIAKMPLPDYDQITLSEWLGLTLLKNAGFNVSKFQMVSYDNEHHEYANSQEYVEESISHASISSDHVLDDDLSFLDNLAQSLNSNLNTMTRKKNDVTQTVPFLISERFDIPYEWDGQAAKNISLDLGAICLVTSEEKYDLSFETVAEKLKQRIPSAALSVVNEDVYKQIIGSYLLHNNDLHLKNITVLGTQQQEGHYEYKVSPIYDVIITPLVITSNMREDIKKGIYKQALTINGTNFPTKNDIIGFAVANFDMPQERAESIFNTAVVNIRKAVKDLEANMPVEISDRKKWHDTIDTGLALIDRNVRHITEHGTAFGTINDREQKQTISSDMMNATHIMPELR